MKRTREEIEAAKAAIKKKPGKARMGRPPKAENSVRLTVYMAEDVERRMRERIRETHDSLSNYITRLVDQDVRGQGGK